MNFNAAKDPKRKTAREIMQDDIKEYLAKPNPKKLKELKDRCGATNINFD